MVDVVRQRQCRSESGGECRSESGGEPRRRGARKRGTGRSRYDRPVHDPRQSGNPNVALARSDQWRRTLVSHRSAMFFCEGHRTLITMPAAKPRVSRHYGGQFLPFLSTTAFHAPRSRGVSTGKCTLQRGYRRVPQGYNLGRCSPRGTAAGQRRERDQAPGPCGNGPRSPRAADSHPTRGETSTRAGPAAAAWSAWCCSTATTAASSSGDGAPATTRTSATGPASPAADPDCEPVTGGCSRASWAAASRACPAAPGAP